MSDQSQILFEKATTIAGWNPGLVTESDIRNRTSGLTPFQKQLAYTAFSDQLSVDAMYFSGEIPFIHFKQLSRYDPNEVHRFHRKIWNEGRTPLLAIITPQEIRLYDCFDSPENDLESLVNLERGRFQNTEHDLKKLGEILHQSKIDSGMIWKEPFGKSIKIKNRVDRKLLNNLANARNLLSKNFHEKAAPQAPLAMTPRTDDGSQNHRPPPLSLRGASFCDEAISPVDHRIRFCRGKYTLQVT